MGLRAPSLVGGAALLAAFLSLTGCPPRGKWPVGIPSELIDRALITALDSSYASERARAAFRIGQLGVAWDPAPSDVQGEADRRLCDRLTKERDDKVRVELVAALGRVGRTRGRAALLAELGRPGPARARAGWALAAMYRRQRDKEIDPSTDVETLAKALLAPEAEVRAAVTDALAEMKREAARPVLLRELSDVDPLARARAARGLVGLAHKEDLMTLERLLGDDDERAAAGAALAIAVLGEHGDAEAIASMLHSSALLTRPTTLLALAQQELRRAELAPLFAGLYRQLEGKGAVQCIAALAHDRVVARVDLLKTCGGAVVDETTRRVLLAAALGTCDAALSLGAVDALLALTADKPIVRELVVTALGRYADPRARRKVIQALDDLDPVVRASAAEVAAEHGWEEAGPAILRSLPPVRDGKVVVDPGALDATLSFVASTSVLHPVGAAERLRPLLDGTPAALALAARDALVKLGEKPSLVHPQKPHGPFDELALPAGPLRVRLETARGEIVIELDPARAPLTVRNFVGLVRRQFYDGILFHRVIPGFVAQAGDPRGDGAGGAGHLVACEPNAAPYLEGTVGMALSGLDSGSSQFFIALAPAPHLEGRYTAFGHVVSGMDVARSLLPNDVIKTAREVP